MTSQSMSNQITPRQSDIALYTCYFGKHEPLNINSLGQFDGADKYIFTDDDTLEYPNANVVVSDSQGINSRLFSRRAKIKPHDYFGKYKWAIYIDNRANLKISPRALIEKIEIDVAGNDQGGRYLFTHPLRDCAYDEIQACIEASVFKTRQAETIKAELLSNGMPEHFGLFANTIMVQKMGNSTTDRMNDLWYELVLSVCSRDQIALSYAMWSLDFKPTVLSFDNSDLIQWPVISRHQRRRFRRKNRKI